MASITDLTIAQIENALDFAHETEDIEADMDRDWEEENKRWAQEEEARFAPPSEEWRKTTRHEGYLLVELDDAFAYVTGGNDPRGPIQAIIPKDRMHIVKTAIIFFTATVPTFSPAWAGWLKVTADGYRAGPAGDH